MFIVINISRVYFGLTDNFWEANLLLELDYLEIELVMNLFFFPA